MKIAYAVVDRDDGDILEEEDSYRKAVQRSEARGTIWLMVDRRIVLKLPQSFNRVVIGGDNRLSSGVLNSREIFNEDNTWPLPEHAPFLIFDHDTQTVEYLPCGIGGAVWTLTER